MPGQFDGAGRASGKPQLIRVDIVLQRTVVEKLVLREQSDHVFAGLAGGRSKAGGPNTGGCLEGLQTLLQRLSLSFRKIGIDPFVKIAMMADLMLIAKNRLDAIRVFLCRPTGNEEGRFQSKVAQKF